MEALKKIVSNQYFPAAAVLTAVVLFWAVGLLGGLSLLNNNQPPLTTLTWMLFVYLAAVLTPLAGILAAVDLVRRWKRNRVAVAGPVNEAAQETAVFEAEPARDMVVHPASAVAASSAPEAAAAQPGPALSKAPQATKNSKQPGRNQAA
ncbi:hypothetical protein FBY31_3970 [Arthrobacter sp. SLBN-100]|uniref:hypothetical protein n=1 Tax=Arthrobacter sp. SLBN-100 TaxID=2768450 RepID=UPI0011505DF3|nr:hypothetical protein [Arthrobacter sp. SLBN-100]TQJ69798.1 hypothetical protein FBY31_3970 [Arthrobacter sp. SLBN-100]